MTADEDALYEMWRKWLKTIENETMTLWLFRDYWQGLVEITQGNPDLPPSTFFDGLGVWYAAAQTTAIRRQLDRDSRSVSLWRLLNDISEHPEVMTCERHVSLWGDEEHWVAEANENYDRFAGKGNDTIASERMLEDRKRLEDIAKPIVDHVNKQVAHTDEENLPAVPTYDELNAALDELGELLKKYVSLFEATILATVAPAHQADWQAPFKVPWIKADC